MALSATQKYGSALGAEHFNYLRGFVFCVDRSFLRGEIVFAWSWAFLQPKNTAAHWALSISATCVILCFAWSDRFRVVTALSATPKYGSALGAEHFLQLLKMIRLQ